MEFRKERREKKKEWDLSHLDREIGSTEDILFFFDTYSKGICLFPKPQSEYTLMYSSEISSYIRLEMRMRIRVQ